MEYDEYYDLFVEDGEEEIELELDDTEVKPEQVKDIVPAYEPQTVYPDPGMTIGQVNIAAIPDPTAVKDISENGDHNVARYGTARVNVQPNLQTPDPITPTEQQQTITPGAGYDGLAQAVVEPIPSEYIKPIGWVLDEMNANGFPTRAKFFPQGENTKIGNYALSSGNGGSLSHITVLEVPEGTTTIGNSAFSNTSITQLILPSTLVMIGDYHVRYCSKLQYIEYRCDCNLFTGYFAGTDLRQMVFRKNVGRIINPGIPSTIELYDFSGSTAVPVLNSAAAISYNENTKIKIPYALSDEFLGVGNGWQSKQYWSDLPSFLWQVQNN